MCPGDSGNDEVVLLGGVPSCRLISERFVPKHSSINWGAAPPQYRDGGIRPRMWGSTAPTLCRSKRSCSIISVPGSAVTERASGVSSGIFVHQDYRAVWLRNKLSTSDDHHQRMSASVVSRIVAAVPSSCARVSPSKCLGCRPKSGSYIATQSTNRTMKARVCLPGTIFKRLPDGLDRHRRAGQQRYGQRRARYGRTCARRCHSRRAGSFSRYSAVRPSGVGKFTTSIARFWRPRAR